MSSMISRETLAAACREPEICPLNKVRAGVACRIRQLAASPEMAHRLRELGFCEDRSVRLLSQSANLICQVCNVRLGISAELASSILVEPISGPPSRR